MVQLLERELSNSDYSNKSEDFLIRKRCYDIQYAPLYAERLVSMRAELEKCAMKKWDYQYDVKKCLVDLETNQKSIIIGTLYKEMKNKPNILKELAEDDNKISEDDKIDDLQVQVRCHVLFKPILTRLGIKGNFFSKSDIVTSILMMRISLF
jgi:hypothetical protein